MDDLISREAVVDTIYKRDERLQRYKEYRNKGDRIDLLGVLTEIHDIPPAFHGMTNGEVLQALFPSVRVNERNVELLGGLDGFSHRFNKEWWNAPYKKGKE